MEDIGGEIVSELSYSMGDTDFSAQLTEFINLDPQPDFLFISANPGEIGTIVQQARDLGLTLPIVGGDGYDTPLLAELARRRRDERLLHHPPGHLRRDAGLAKPSTRPTKPSTATRRKRSSRPSATTASS